MSSVGLLVGWTRLTVSSVGLASRGWARVRLLVDGEHRLVTGEPLMQHADLVDGFGRWRLRLDSGRRVVPRAETSSASSSASPSSTATPSSGRLLLLLICGLGLAALLRAEPLGVPRDEAVSAYDRLEARIGVIRAVRDWVEAVRAPVVLDAGDRLVLDRRALDLRARHRHALEVRPLVRD